MRKWIWLLALGLSLGFSAAAKAEGSFQFGLNGISGPPGQQGASVTFPGNGTFSFTNPSNGSGWTMTVNNVMDSASPGVTTLNNAMANITGTFTIGPVQTLSAPPGLPATQYATVGVPQGAQLQILDSAGKLFTADITSWDHILTTGTTSSLNAIGDINVDDFSYSGTDQNLTDLIHHHKDASLTISFTFDPAISLSQLATGSGPYTGPLPYNSGGITGSFCAAPTPASAVMMVLGSGLLGGMGWLRRRRFLALA